MNSDLCENSTWRTLLQCLLSFVSFQIRQLIEHSGWIKNGQITWRCIWRKCKFRAESRCLLTVMPVTGPGTRLLCHGEQSVRDIGQKAVKVEHVGLHRRGLGLRVHLIGPLLQLRLADGTLECVKHKLTTTATTVFLHHLSPSATDVPYLPVGSRL